MIKYYEPTPNTMRKFNQNGNVIKYLGNTIVSMMNTEEFSMVKIGQEVQSVLKNHSFGEKFYMLPEDSFHMTIISLLNDLNSGNDLWPDYLPEGSSMYNADRIILDKVSTVKKPKNIQMVLTKINPTRVELKPANEETAIALREYRDTIATITDTKRKFHNEYKFHLSIAYIFDALTEQENIELNYILDELNEKYANNNAIIQIPEPEFVIFNDMLTYYDDLEKRVE